MRIRGEEERQEEAACSIDIEKAIEEHQERIQRKEQAEKKAAKKLKKKERHETSGGETGSGKRKMDATSMTILGGEADTQPTQGLNKRK